MHFVYLLKSLKDEKHYVGLTSDINERLQRHNAGRVPSTMDRRPFELIAYFSLSSKQRAERFERYLKSGSGRAFLKKHVV